MIIGISGKIGSGKDEIGIIIRWLTNQRIHTDPNVVIGDDSIAFYQPYEEFKVLNEFNPLSTDKFHIKKFADKLKDIVCILIGCTREDLESHEFKNKELGEEWWYYGFGGATDNSDFSIMIPYLGNDYTKGEEPLEYLVKLTPRKLLQLLGTEAGRNIIHPNIWVNALFSEYISTGGKMVGGNSKYELNKEFYPNWVITDMRFPNELAAVKERGGISIRVNRYPKTLIRSRGPEDNTEIPFDINNPQHRDLYKGECLNQHPSETALDDATFDYVIDNNGTIKDLIKGVRLILIKEKII